MTELEPGADFRKPEYRRAVFLRFYAWSVKHRSFPGAVHYVLPHLAKQLQLDLEQRYWLAWINANTQNPVTTLLLFNEAPRREQYRDAISFWQTNYRALDWDTDRRYHKAAFGRATERYVSMTDCTCSHPQRRYFSLSMDWDVWWRAALALPTMGRLSTWSYLEYLRILLGPGTVPDADTLMLGDIQGSRSHRNGLALVLGRDDLIVDKQLGLPGSDDSVYTAETVKELSHGAQGLVDEIRTRVGPAADVLSLESALCTYKGWHKPNRRYPGVYNDMFYNRLITAENRFGRRFGALWDARREALPPRLRLEDSPHDPGLSPVKQNWYLTTGEIINMSEDWPCFANGFERAVAAGDFGVRTRPWL